MLFARIMSQNVLKHLNLHDRVKQAIGRRFWGLPQFQLSRPLIQFMFTFFQQQIGSLMFKKNIAKEFIQIAIYFVFLPF